MPDNVLDELTPERLLADAAWHEKEARLFRRDMIEMETGRRIPAGRGLVSIAERHERAGTLCRAVANAERWLKAQDRGISYDPKGGMGGRGFFTVDHVEKEWSNAYKTLAAALASIHPEAGGTA